MEKPLVRGEVVFDFPPPNLFGAKMHIRLEDTSLADVPSRLIAEKVLTDLPARLTANDRIPFVLFGRQPDPKVRYSVSVHVDIQVTGRINPGDYINTVSYPVLTFGHPDYIIVRVRLVKDILQN